MDILKLFGPPGTGKTTALLEIMERELARGTRPDRLAFLTFTRHARQVAIKRATEKFGLEPEDLPFFRTLHAICYSQLNMSAAGMVKGGKDLQELGDLLGMRFSSKGGHVSEDMLDFPSGGEVGDRLLQFYHVQRHNLMSTQQAWRGKFDDDVTDYQIRHFIRTYEDWKKREGRRDFTDLLLEATTPLAVDVVIVDEAQDLSELQWQALHNLCCFADRMYLAGDDDQAIYTWAGASPSAFVRHDGKVEVLGQSYRVPARAAELARKVISRVANRQPKEWRPRPEDGVLRFRGDPVGLKYDEPGTHLVLYRHHYLVQDLEAEVRLNGIPYARNDRPAPGAEWGKAIIFWERLRRGQELTWPELKWVVDGIAIEKGITRAGQRLFWAADKAGKYKLSDLPAFGISTTVEWYKALTKILPDDAAYLRTIIKHHKAAALTERPKLHLSTIHAAKGAEGEHVTLLTETSRRVRDQMDINPDDERRVFYVGITRAKESLTVVGVDNPIIR